MMATQERRDWSDLKPELLELVLRRLVLQDYLKCRRVCRSWRSITIPHFPSLLLLPPAWYLKCSFKKVPATLLDITGNKLQQQLMIPTHAWEGFCPWVQAQEGWLMFQDYIPMLNNIAYTLFWIFNPVSGEKFMLPRLPYSPRVTVPCMKLVFSSAPDSQNFLAVIASLIEADSIPQLCLCRYNDKSWTPIETNETCFKDIMLFDWKLYAMNTHSVTIFNLRDPNAITAQRLVVQLPEFVDPTCKLARDPTCGEILLLLFTGDRDEVKDIHIFKLDMSDPRWTEVDSLNGRLVFVDRFGVRVISTTNLKGPPEFMKGNCVFFSLFPPKKPRLGVFSLKEKFIEQFDVNFPRSSQFLWFSKNK